MKNFLSLCISLVLCGHCYAQILPVNSYKGAVKTVRDSVTLLHKNQNNLNYQLHKNEYHHGISFQRTDSLFKRQWFLTATSPERKTVSTYDRNQYVIHREWYDHVLEYQFKEDFVYHEKDIIQFYEVKNVPLKRVTIDENNKKKYSLRLSNDYNRKAYFEYNDATDVTFEMNQDDFSSMKKFYYEYDMNGLPSVIKHFLNSNWLWSENLEYSRDNSINTFLYPRGKRFPFLTESKRSILDSNSFEIEYSLIPEGSYYGQPRSKRILELDGNTINANEYWFNLPTKSESYEFKKTVTNETKTEGNKTVKTTRLEGKKLFTETITKGPDGKMTEYLSYSNLYKLDLEKYQFTYNEEGDISEVKSYIYELDQRITLESTITFDYTYDIAGNWTQQIKSINGTPIFEWNRYIEYYEPKTSR